MGRFASEPALKDHLVEATTAARFATGSHHGHGSTSPYVNEPSQLMSTPWVSGTGLGKLSIVPDCSHASERPSRSTSPAPANSEPPIDTVRSFPATSPD